MPSYMHCSKVEILIILCVAAGYMYRGGYGGVIPQRIREQFVGQFHPLCKGSNGADESCCIYTPEYVHATRKRPKKTSISIKFCKGGFSGNLEGLSLKISPEGQLPDSHFLSSPVSYHSASN